MTAAVLLFDNLLALQSSFDYINNLKDYDGALGNLTIQEKGDVHLPTQIVKIKNGENIPVNK